MQATRFETMKEMEASTEPGYCLLKSTDAPFVDRLWVRLPTGVGSRLPLGKDGWQVEEHEDGTISVTPSIWDKDPSTPWHGWLQHDQFVSC